jgi:heme/copper-type cytochrome/quinol oxidase subunit 1
MTAVLMRVPVADAADATGVVVTVNQLALVIGVATFGTLYLNQAGPLPAPAEHAAFTLVSAHAVAVTFLVLAAAAVAGGVLALARMLAARPARTPVTEVPAVALSVPAGASPTTADPGGARDA